MKRGSAWISICFKTAAAVFFLSARSAQALGPHECALIVNGNSRASIEVANFYADLRQIPSANIVRVDIPDPWLSAGAAISPEDFRAIIYEPVVKTLAERKLPHILAWIYSVDFPSTINTAPPMSLTGITLVRGLPPAREDIQSGTWLSRLYAGPDKADGPASPSISLENISINLGTNMLLPAMMLGWTGSRGMTTEEITGRLRQTFLSDGSNPEGKIFLEVSDDIRSKTRAWQFDGLKKELAGKNIEAITSQSPPESSAWLGAMIGRAEYNAKDFGYLGSGAYADSLTSFGALFNTPEQTKMTDWLMRGAAGSSGTITEPGSRDVPVILWPKFPSARLFSHYANGCSLLESFYLSTRSPLQILPVGDPLCRPWGTGPFITLINLDENESRVLSGEAKFMATLGGGFAGGQPNIMFLMNGRPILTPGKNTPGLGIQTVNLPDGYHELRAVAYSQGMVRQQGFASYPFVTRNRGRSVILGGYTNKQEAAINKPLVFSVTAEGEPTQVAIICQEREMARAAYSPGVELAVKALDAGLGPVSFQAVAFYSGTETARSSPLKLTLINENTAPVIEGAIFSTNEAGNVCVQMQSSDPDGDYLKLRWCLDLLNWRIGKDPEINNQGLHSLEQPQLTSSIQMSFMLSGASADIATLRAGLYFNHLDDKNYFYWGFDTKTSAWILERVRDGQADTLFSRGAPLRTGTVYALAVEADSNNKCRLILNHKILGYADLGFGPGQIGTQSGVEEMMVTGLLVSPPGAVNSRYKGNGLDDLCLEKPDAPAWIPVVATASDGSTVSVKPVNAIKN